MEWTTGGDPAAKVKGEPSSQGQFCIHCNAWKGSLGLEPTPELYISHMVQVFSEVKRVLRSDGAVFINLGDSYGTGTRADRRPGNKNFGEATAKAQGIPRHGGMAKQLLMIPARVALALQADGWYLRSAMPWVKRSAMPESVTDRPASALEYMFLFAKSQKYYFDMESIRVKQADFSRGAEGKSVGSIDERPQNGVRTGTMNNIDRNGAKREYNPAGRNFRNTDLYMRSLEDGFEQEEVQNLSENKTDNGILHRQNGPRRTAEPMQRMFSDEAERIREQPKDTPKIPKEQECTGAAELPQIQREIQCPESNPQDVRVDQRQGIPEKILENGKGERKESDSKSQTASGNKGGFCGSDRRSMENDKNGVRESMRLLQTEDATDDDGSHSTPKPERGTHGQQHSSVMPFMQQSEERQDGSRMEATSDSSHQQIPIHTQNATAPLGAIFADDEMVGLDVNPQAMKEAHFATFPENLIEPCILAGTSERGCCPECLAPWERVVEKESKPEYRPMTTGALKKKDLGDMARTTPQGRTCGTVESKTIGWKPSCNCIDTDEKAEAEVFMPPIPCTVLDPFFGAGTTGIVAHKLNRNFIGIELSVEYLKDIAVPRIKEATAQVKWC